MHVPGVFASLLCVGGLVALTGSPCCCVGQLDLPPYSSAALLQRQLLTAAENCVSYDLDNETGATGVELSLDSLPDTL